MTGHRELGKGGGGVGVGGAGANKDIEGPVSVRHWGLAGKGGDVTEVDCVLRDLRTMMLNFACCECVCVGGGAEAIVFRGTSGR